MARTKQTARSMSGMGMSIDMHRAQPMGVTTLMYVGDSADGLGGDPGTGNLGTWALIGGALLVLGLWLGKP
jgi:hypothetical protein